MNAGESGSTPLPVLTCVVIVLWGLGGTVDKAAEGDTWSTFTDRIRR